jgi:hypothetical protein
LEVEIVVENLKIYKSPGLYQIIAELVQAGGKTLSSEAHKRVNSTWNKVEFSQQRKVSIIVIRRVIKVTVVIVELYQRYQLHKTIYSMLFVSRLTSYV